MLRRMREIGINFDREFDALLLWNHQLKFESAKYFGNIQNYKIFYVMVVLYDLHCT